MVSASRSDFDRRLVGEGGPGAFAGELPGADEARAGCFFRGDIQILARPFLPRRYSLGGCVDRRYARVPSDALCVDAHDGRRDLSPVGVAAHEASVLSVEARPSVSRLV